MQKRYFIIKTTIKRGYRIISVKLAPHYKHFMNFMGVLTSFAIVLEFLIGFRNSSGLLMHKECDVRNAELTSRTYTVLENSILHYKGRNRAIA